MVHSYTRTGEFNIGRNYENQDAVFRAESDEYVFIALADGVSECSCGGTGAKIACRAAADIMMNEAERLLCFAKEKIAYLLIEHVLYTVERTLGKDGLRECASTLLCALIEKATGNVLLFNLGDGSAVRMRNLEMSVELLPNKINGIPAQTTSENAYLAAEVKRIRLHRNETIILFSDGMLDAFAKNCVFRQNISAGDTENADRELDAMRSTDDMSYIMYVFR